MRVAMVTSMDNYGVGTHTRNLIHSLRKLGIDVDIFDGQGDIGTILLKPQNYDIVHAQCSMYRPFRSKTPLVVTVHTLLKTERKYGEHKYDPMYLPGVWAEKRTLNHADRIIVVNQRLLQEITDYFDIGLAHISMIPNGINVREFEGHELKREGWFMTAGRDIPRKDIDTFRQACARAKVSTVEYQGGAPRNILIEAFMTAKAFVCSSYYETGPITVLEAMAARCPLIITNEVAEWMYPPRPPGFWFRAGDVEGLTFAIQRLMKYDDDYLKQMTDNAYKMLEPYSWDNIAKQTLKVYEELV